MPEELPRVTCPEPTSDFCDTSLPVAPFLHPECPEGSSVDTACVQAARDKFDAAVASHFNDHCGAVGLILSNYAADVAACGDDDICKNAAACHAQDQLDMIPGSFQVYVNQELVQFGIDIAACCREDLQP